MTHETMDTNVMTHETMDRVVFLQLNPPTTSRSKIGAWIISLEAEREEKSGFGARVITFGWPLEFGKEFLHPVAHHLHLVVTHHPATP